MGRSYGTAPRVVRAVIRHPASGIRRELESGREDALMLDGPDSLYGLFARSRPRKPARGNKEQAIRGASMSVFTHPPDRAADAANAYFGTMLGLLGERGPLEVVSSS